MRGYIELYCSLLDMLLFYVIRFAWIQAIYQTPQTESSWRQTPEQYAS